MIKIPENEDLTVKKIRNGTVIDHIPYENVGLVTSLIILEEAIKNKLPTIVFYNAGSDKYGIKGIIKISDFYLDRSKADILSLVFPEITVNYIHDWMAKKYLPTVPERIKTGIKCPEVSCITNTKEPVAVDFFVLPEEKILQCSYCDSNLPFAEIPSYITKI